MHTVFIKYPKIVKSRIETKSWGYFVKKRDDYACVLCNSTENVEAHHIERWVDSPWKRKIMENGISLCKKCHLSIHNNKGEKPSLEKTYELVCKLKETLSNKFIKQKGHPKRRRKIKENLERLDILACDISSKISSSLANLKPKTFLIKKEINIIPTL